MSSLKSTLSLIGVLAASLAAGYFAYRVSQPETATTREVARDTVGDPVEERSTAMDSVELEGPDGAVFTLSQWQGQPKIVNFWATWCGPCREEMPVLVDAYDKYAEQGLVVIGLSMDYPDDTELVKQFVDEYDVRFPILMAVEQGNALAEYYGAENFVLPISVFVAADGTVTSVHTGLLTADEAEKELAQLFPAGPST